MKTITSKFLALAIVLITMGSCMTTKTQVGTYKEQQGKEYTYDKIKQVWLFWGVIPVGRASANTPASGNCEVITKLKFVDMLITSLTGGIVSTYSIKIKAKEEVNSLENK
jgi:hypothetical protein